jgi:hypothetical protein
MQHDGVTVEMPMRRPLLLSPRVLEVNYAPAQRRRELRESGQPWREMTDDEASSVHAWLALLTSDVMAAAGRLMPGGD